MISDDPDEDADQIEDETLLEGLITDNSPAQSDTARGAPVLPDWPAVAGRGVGIHVDPSTLAWFQSTYADWQQQITAVLRAWVAAHQTAQHTRRACSIELPRLAAPGS